MYYWDDDDLIKQKISAELEKYTMSQKEVADYLQIKAPALNRLVNEKRVIPMYVYNSTSSRKMYIFFKPDVDKYKERLEAIRLNRIIDENS
ncbi:DNA-binding protein [Listeria weihenstephanensis]|uniref:DNA-binding protein n=1 Tax=Listeria weihenstephanensis TaxID=1006155 RepID=A0A841Z6Q2_9LIST|nr:DNA-binding protein [Listeria weihenstephanensis]MBC1500026.1 DNA-binding protein [Listeria weihenstephanensis]